MNVSLYLTISIDGFIAHNNDTVPWGEEAWIRFCDRCNKETSCIIGRTSYLLFQNDPGSSMLKTSRLVVVSSQLNKTYRPSDIIVRSPYDAINYLKNEGHSSTLIIGGHKLAKSFLELHLINSIELDIAPFIVGDGIQLFGNLAKPVFLHRTDTTEQYQRLKYKIKA